MKEKLLWPSWYNATKLDVLCDNRRKIRNPFYDAKMKEKKNISLEIKPRV